MDSEVSLQRIQLQYRVLTTTSSKTLLNMLSFYRLSGSKSSSLGLII